MGRMPVVLLAALVALVTGTAGPVAAGASGPGAASGAAAAGTQVVTWAASPDFTITKVAAQTVRNVVTTTVAGTSLQVSLSNEFGTKPLTFGPVAVGRVQSGAQLVSGSSRQVFFGGSPTVTVPVGAEVLSDPAPIPVAARQTLAVRIYLAGQAGNATGHNLALTDTFLSVPGDHATEDGAESYTRTVNSWAFLESLVVTQRSTVRTVVGFGDSITDGVGSTAGANRRWTDVLAARLNGQPSTERRGVANEGISANRVLTGGFGEAGVVRFRGDVLAQPGVESVILLEGINDINTGSTAGDLIEGYRSLIDQAHSTGVCLLGGTLTPNEGGTAQREAERQAVNDFIRSSGEFDGVVDFDAAVRDPADPADFLDRYDSGDGLHPSDAGYRVMGLAVPLPLLDCSR